MDLIKQDNSDSSDDEIVSNLREFVRDLIYKLKTSSSEEKMKEMGSKNDILEDYNAYLALADQPSKPFGDNILTLEEFININYVTFHADKDLTFVPPGLINRNTAANVLAGVSTVREFLSTASAVRQDVNEIVEELRSATSNIPGSSKFIDVMTSPGDSGDRGGNNGGFGGSGSYSHYDASKLSYGMKSIEVRLNTGIKPNCYGVYYQDALTNSSPLHLTMTRVTFLGMTPGSPVDTFYSVVLSTIFQNLAQAAVSFNINANTAFSDTNLRNYFDAVALALSYYYYYGGIITYCNNPQNRNEGMIKLRNMMSANDLNDLSQLQMILMGTPIPPNLNHLIFWLHQTYRDSTLPGAALLKIAPFPFAATTDAANKFSAFPAGYINNAILNLISGQNRTTGSLMARCCPGWTSEQLLAPTDMPLHDPGFCTLWANLPNVSVYTSGSAVKTPSVTSLDSSISYNSYTNDLDGAISGLVSVYDSTNSYWLPTLLDCGIINVYATTKYSNRVSFLKGTDGENTFYPITAYPGPSLHRGETFYLTGTSVAGYQKFGTEVVLNMNVNSIKETAQKLIQWLLSLDSIGSGVKALKDRSIPEVRHVNSGKSKSTRKKSFKGKRKMEEMKE